MRQIKFRGKRIDNGEWVYGQLLTNKLGTYIISEENPHECTQYFYIEICEYYRVDPETVGQYTGLQDRNGHDCYEGNYAQNESTLYKIEWCEKTARYGAKIMKSDHVLGRGLTFPLRQYVDEETEMLKFEIIDEHPHLLEVESNGIS